MNNGKDMQNIDFGAVHRCTNLVDFETCNMNVYFAKIGFDTDENEPSKVSSISL